MNQYINKKYLAYLVALAFGLSLLQDVLHASVRHHAFYLSEALLFNTFWLLVLPLTLLLRKQINGAHSRGRPVQKGLLLAGFSSLHLLLFALVLFGGSAALMGHTYSFGWSLRYALSDCLYLSFGVYALALLPAQAAEEKRAAFSAEKNNDQPSSLLVNTRAGTRYIPLGEIRYLQAERPYVAVFTNEGKFLAEHTLKEMERLMKELGMVRIHRSCLASVDDVVSKESRGNGDYDLLLKDGTRLRLSRHYVREFNARMERHRLSLS